MEHQTTFSECSRNFNEKLEKIKGKYEDRKDYGKDLRESLHSQRDPLGNVLNSMVNYISETWCFAI